MDLRRVAVFAVLVVVVAGVCAYFIVKRSIGGSREESVFRAAILYDNLHGPPEGFSGALEVLKELSDDMLSRDSRRRFLKVMCDACMWLNVVLVYLVRGGCMGQHVQSLVFCE